MQTKIPCSVLVLTRNSADTLDRCLKNLGDFGEIVVHDANSEDDSVAIAANYGAKVFPQYEDTTEKSVRIRDFTEMRLKQRAAAAYDWVFYLDADEYVEEAFATELRDILATAELKTIIKVHHVPVIDGQPRYAGLAMPEIVPRIHNKKSGCTLKSNKAVHEKYVYDHTFREVVMHSPVFAPLSALADLLRKDARYITLERERIKRDGYPWTSYLRWILLREPVLVAWLALQILVHLPRYRKPDSVPFAHDWRYVRYHAALFAAFTGALLRHPFTRGKVQA